MYIIDQHAAYERINYERYMKRLAEKEVSKMSMLIPITIEFSPSEYLDLMQKKEILTSLNIDIEEFGESTLDQIKPVKKERKKRQPIVVDENLRRKSR